MANFSVDSLSSYDKILGSLSAYNASGRVREDLDFSDFSNFVWFGSARFEVDNAVLEIQENYPNFTKWDIRSDNLIVTADDSIVSHYLGWKLAADPFVEYFVNSIATYTVTVTVTGATYAKGNTSAYTFTFPWFDTTNKNVSPFTLGQQGEIESWELSGDEFDESNFKSILKTIPDVVTEKDEDLKTLLSAVGHFFDNMLLQSQKTLDVYNLSYKFDQMPDAKTLDAFIDSIGMGRFYQFTEKNLLEYYESIYNTELTYSKKQFAKLMKIIFINNITKVIKSKGTKEAVRFAENIFGWPDNLVTVEEYIHVSDRLPSSGIQFDIPNIELRSFLLNSSTAQYHDFTASNISLNHSMSSTESGENGLVFSFKLNDAQDLRTGSGYWQDNTKQLFELKSVNDGYTFADLSGGYPNNDTNLVASSYIGAGNGGPADPGSFKPDMWVFSADEKSPFGIEDTIWTLSSYISDVNFPATSISQSVYSTPNTLTGLTAGLGYRCSVYIKHDYHSDIPHTFSFRTSSPASVWQVLHSSGTADVNSRWNHFTDVYTVSSNIDSDILKSGKWYLITSYLFSDNTTFSPGDSISSAIYDLDTGEKVTGYTDMRDYALSSTSEFPATLEPYVSHYLSSGTISASRSHTTKAHNIRVDLLDGTEPSIEELLFRPQVDRDIASSPWFDSSGEKPDGVKKASEYSFSAYGQSPFKQNEQIRTLSAYIDADDLPCTACSNSDRRTVNFEGLLNGYTYRIATYVKCNSASSDVNFYFGYNLLKELGAISYTYPSGTAADAYSNIYNSSYVNFGEESHELGGNKWYLFLGYFFPNNYDWSSHSLSSAIYDIETGEIVTGKPTTYTRDWGLSSSVSSLSDVQEMQVWNYQLLTESLSSVMSGSHSFDFYRTIVEKLDGTELSIEQLLTGPQTTKTTTFSASGASSGFVLSIDDEGLPATASQISTKFPLTDTKWSNVSKSTTFNLLLNPTSASNNNLSLFGTYYPGTSPEKVNLDPGSVSSYTLGSFVYDTNLIYNKTKWQETRQSLNNPFSSDEFDPLINWWDEEGNSYQDLFGDWNFVKVPLSAPYIPFSYSKKFSPFNVGSAIDEYGFCISGQPGSAVGNRIEISSQIDNTKTYRYSAFVKKNTDNHILDFYFGYKVNAGYFINYNGSNTSNALNYNFYNISFDETGLQAQKWYLFVGYIFPQGYDCNEWSDPVSSAIYDVDTGERIIVSDFSSDLIITASTSFETNLFIYPYKASPGIEENEEFLIFHPQINEIDGSEPTIEELLDFSFAYSNEVNNWDQFKFMQDSITGLSPLAFKLYNESLWINNSNTEILSGVSSHLLDWEHIWKSNEKSSDPNKTPKKWYKFAQASSSIPDSVIYRSIWDPISLTALSGSEKAQTVKKPVFGSKKVTYNSGNIVDEIGIYPDTSEMDYVRSSNRLKIAISPANIMNILITRILAINNFENLYGKPEDLYNDRYTYLTELKQYVLNILAQYDNEWYNGTFTRFFDVLQRGYSENIVNFIVENLVPAKSQTIAGLFIENDKLYDRKYKWTKPQIEDVVLEDDYRVNREQHGEDLLQETQINQLHNYEVEDNYSETSVKYSTNEYAENLYSYLTINWSKQFNSEDETISEDEINWQHSAPIIQKEYEWTYWYSPLQIWDFNIDFQGKETNVVSLSGASLYGKSKWKAPSSVTRSTFGWREELAHLENSNLIFNANKKDLYGKDDFGQLHINLLRYGFPSPNSYIKVFIPGKSENDNDPIICLSGLKDGDKYTVPISSCNEYSIKLEENGRNISYYVNSEDFSNTGSIQAETKLDFGSKSLTPIIVPVQATLLNQGAAGNGMIVEIILNNDLDSSYAICEVIRENHLIISVCEAPYIIWNLIPAIEENSIAQSLFEFDFSELKDLQDSGANEDDYRSNTLGKFYLQDGSDNILNIKNRDYKIELINVYNNEKENFIITPRSKMTQTLNLNYDLEEQSPNW